MNPVSSARGINWAGDTIPSFGCFQRINASKPITCFVLCLLVAGIQGKIHFVVMLLKVLLLRSYSHFERYSFLLRRKQIDFSICFRAIHSHISIFINAVTSVPQSGYIAIPILGVIDSSSSLMKNGLFKIFKICSAIKVHFFLSTYLVIEL